MSTMPEPTATDMARDLRAGKVRVREVVDACLARIAADEPRVQAWTFLDPAHAQAQADRLDADKRAGRPLGPLFGLPVGVKDIFDTVDMPTENGSPLCAGRRPPRGAWVVSRLRAAGAVVMGKTVTTEFACFAPGKTRNPHAPDRTPGGSSSGSAAAVASGMVPIALGSQTNGSVIRPASFCGVFGFKPSFGLIPRTGVLTTSRTLDHVGVFARALEDAALLAEVLAGFSPEDPATLPVATPPLVEAAGRGLPVRPRLAFVQGPTWDAAEPATRDAFAELAETLGDRLAAVELPPAFAEAIAVHRTIWTAELACHLDGLHARGRERMSPELQALIDAGSTATALAYQRALAERDRYRQALAELLQTFDAIVTPAAPGEAPLGLEATGSPVFCSLWTLAGLPAVSLPIFTGPNDLPVGCQLVGAPGEDARLMAAARSLLDAVQAD
jgi:Asp-tRNA(Asn)/Glu-tRNA(Gln) amidotransferase A subunit family amidase